MMKLRTLTSRKVRLVITTAVAIAAALVCACFYVRGKIRTTIEHSLAERGLAATWKHYSWTPASGIRFTGLRLWRQHTHQMLAATDNLRVRFPLTQFLEKGGRVSYWAIKNSSISVVDDKGPIVLENVSLNFELRPHKAVITHATATHGGLVARITGDITLNPTPRPPQPFLLNLSAVRATLGVLKIQQKSDPFLVTGKFSVDRTSEKPTWSTSLKGTGNNITWHGIPLTSARAEAELASSNSRISTNLTTTGGTAHATLTRDDWTDSPLAFEGTLADTARRSDTFLGSYQKNQLTLTSLEGDADLWQIASTLPVVKDKLPSKLSFQKFPKITARNFIYHISSDSPRWTLDSLEASGEAKLSISLKKGEIKVSQPAARVSFDGESWTIHQSSAQLLDGNATATGRFKEGTFSNLVVIVKDLGMAELRRLSGTLKGKPSPGKVSGKYRGSFRPTSRELNGKGSLTMENAPVVAVPLLDQVHDVFASLIPGVDRATDGEGRFEADFSAESSTIHVSRFDATGGSLYVTAHGSIDLENERVSGRARGKLTGLPGVITSPLSRLLEMEVSGPYSHVEVKPIGPAEVAASAASAPITPAAEAIEDAGEAAGKAIRKTLTAPLRLLDRAKNKE